MPLYEYECDACGQRFELIRKFSESALDACTLCGKGPVRRLQSSPAIQFKGSGWYITDYSSKGKANTDSATPKDGESKPASTSSEGSATKTESTSSTAAPKSSSQT
jgi:putative FmdB family regulatory protein